MWTDEEIKGKILHKLTRMGKFEHSHTAIDHLHKGFPGELRGRAKAQVEELIREDILRAKPTSYGVEVSINLEKRERVLHYIRRFLDC